VGILEPENVTANEYEEAYLGLQRFLEVDITEIHTLEDLSAKASLVGRNLRVVVLAQGEVETHRFDYREPGETNYTPMILRDRVCKSHLQILLLLLYKPLLKAQILTSIKVKTF